MDSKELVALLPLLSQLTVRKVIEAGDDAIDAAGLNPYCLAAGIGRYTRFGSVSWSGSIQSSIRVARSLLAKIDRMFGWE